MEVNVKYLPERNMFYAVVETMECILQYRVVNATTWDYTHTFVPRALRGRGIANAIIKFALDYAREHNLRVIPSCPKVESYVSKHHEYDDILEPVN